VEPFDEAMRYPTVFEFGEEYIMIHSVERLGKIDKQGADRATLIQGTASGVEDKHSGRQTQSSRQYHLLTTYNQVISFYLDE